MNQDKYSELFKKKKQEYQIENNYYIIEKLEKLPKRYFYRIIKRCFDIICSFIGLIVLFIPMIIISILIKINSKGPIFYKQVRLGKNRKSFKIIKFRSMTIDAEKNGAQWASKDDNRVTKVGKFLRKSRFDEFPQLINILLGDMSIVGPRPEREVFYKEFDKYIKGFDQRMLIIPGLTGLAQINGGYDLLPEEKIIFDIEYIKNRSLFLDLKVIFQTINIVFSHEGSR